MTLKAIFLLGIVSLTASLAQAQPRSQYVAFVDEIFKVPTAGLGTLRIGAVDAVGTSKFHIAALLFDQGGFTNVVPAVIR